MAASAEFVVAPKHPNFKEMIEKHFDLPPKAALGFGHDPKAQAVLPVSASYEYAASQASSASASIVARADVEWWEDLHVQILEGEEKVRQEIAAMRSMDDAAKAQATGPGRAAVAQSSAMVFSAAASAQKPKSAKRLNLERLISNVTEAHRAKLELLEEYLKHQLEQKKWSKDRCDKYRCSIYFNVFEVPVLIRGEGKTWELSFILDLLDRALPGTLPVTPNRIEFTEIDVELNKTMVEFIEDAISDAQEWQKQQAGAKAQP